MSALDLIGLATGNPAFVSSWDAGCRADHVNERLWIAKLRNLGIKAAHPDDGWVDREENKLTFAYPQFNDGVEVGDLVCLGWAGQRSRVMKITAVKRSDFFDSLVYYYFEQVDPMNGFMGSEASSAQGVKPEHVVEFIGFPPITPDRFTSSKA